MSMFNKTPVLATPKAHPNPRMSESYAKAIEEFTAVQHALREQETEIADLKVRLATEQQITQELQYQLDREKNRADSYSSVVNRFVAHSQHIAGACNAMQREVAEAARMNEEAKKLAKAKTPESVEKAIENEIKNLRPNGTLGQ